MVQRPAKRSIKRPIKVLHRPELPILDIRILRVRVAKRTIDSTLRELKLVANCFGLKLEIHPMQQNYFATTYQLEVRGEKDLTEAYIEDVIDWLGKL